MVKLVGISFPTQRYIFTFHGGELKNPRGGKRIELDRRLLPQEEQAPRRMEERRLLPGDHSKVSGSCSLPAFPGASGNVKNLL